MFILRKNWDEEWDFFFFEKKKKENYKKSRLVFRCFYFFFLFLYDIFRGIILVYSSDLYVCPLINSW